MITSELYTAAATFDNATVTEIIPNIPILTENFTRAYWLGWIDNNNMPDVFKVGTFALTIGDESAVTFTDITDYTQNRDYTYFASIDGSGGYSTLFSSAETYRDVTLTPEKWVSGGVNARLVNDMIYQATGYNSIQLNFICPATADCTRATYTATVDIKQFIDFLTGDDAIAITVDGVTHNIRGTDFDETGVLWMDYSITPDDVRPVFIGGYYFLPGNSVLPGTRYFNLYPAIHAEYNYDDTVIDAVACTRGSAGNDVFLRINADNLNVSFIMNKQIYPDNTNTSPKCLYGLNTSIKISDLGTLTTEPFIQDGVCVSYSYGSGGSPFFYDFYKIFKPSDIYRHAALLRWCVGSNVIGYSENVVFYPKIDLNTNEFLCELLTGAESAVKPKIPAWMKYTLEESIYTPDDKPLPEIIESDSDGDDILPFNFGTSPIGNANNFVTLYALTSANVVSFGEQLWSNLGDPAYMAMVGTVFTNDLSINPADILKYINFLRYYPFDLEDAGVTDETQTGIYIGRATTAIVPTGGIQPFRITQNIATLDGGTLTIPKFYGDFRDYEPCANITLHVPFCGTAELCPSEVVGKTLSLKYYVDLQTGALKAIVTLYSDTTYIVASLAGTCGASIQITTNNNLEFLQRIATVATGTIVGMAGGSTLIGSLVGAGGGGIGALAGLPPVSVHSSGNTSGFANLAGSDTAFITIQYQKYIVPSNYGHTTGYAVQFDDDIKNLSGYVLCENVDTTGLTCSEDERTAIKQLLEHGIYV